jgi:3',5'-cyclic AMP phosphodiesterase CpdA
MGAEASRLNVACRTASAVGLLLALLVASPATQAPFAAPAPHEPGSVRFAVIGDSGRGSREQHEVADQMSSARKIFPFDFTIMLGDNLYEFRGPEDYVIKFEKPYAELLRNGVEFFAAIGNHDPPNEQYYRQFNMEGRRYYTFKKGDVRFFVLDSTALGPRQLAWFDDQLADSQSRWKIVYMHHPMYTSGRYGRGARLLRAALEPIIVGGGVKAVFSGHEHFYERFKPQRGVTYFISGGAGSLRAGDIRADPAMARGFDRDFHFMLVEIGAEHMYFYAIDRKGQIVDSGSISR